MHAMTLPAPPLPPADCSPVGMARETTDPLEAFLVGVERRAFKMAMLTTRDEDEALEVVQEAMVALVTRYRERPAGEWPALFQRILNSKLMDWHRRQQRQQRRFGVWSLLTGLGRPEDQDEGAMGDPLDAIPDPNGRDGLGALTVEQLSVAMEQAIAALPMRQRQTVLLRAWEGLDVAETARALGISEGSVKTHYFRAMAALRQSLSAWAD